MKENIEDLILKRATWLYCYNGGHYTKLECAKKATIEWYGKPEFISFIGKLATMYDTNVNECIDGFIRNIENKITEKI